MRNLQDTDNKNLLLHSISLGFFGVAGIFALYSNCVTLEYRWTYIFPLVFMMVTGLLGVFVGAFHFELMRTVQFIFLSLSVLAWSFILIYYFVIFLYIAVAFRVFDLNFAQLVYIYMACALFGIVFYLSSGIILAKKLHESTKMAHKARYGLNERLI